MNTQIALSLPAAQATIAFREGVTSAYAAPSDEAGSAEYDSWSAGTAEYASWTRQQAVAATGG